MKAVSRKYSFFCAPRSSHENGGARFYFSRLTEAQFLRGVLPLLLDVRFSEEQAMAMENFSPESEKIQ